MPHFCKLRTKLENLQYLVSRSIIKLYSNQGNVVANKYRQSSMDQIIESRNRFTHKYRQLFLNIPNVINGERIIFSGINGYSYAKT